MFFNSLGDSGVTAYIDTSSEGHPTHVISSLQHHQAYYYNGKSYVVWMKRNAGDWDNENVVFNINNSTGVISAGVDIGKTSADVDDLHAHGTIFVTSTGRILVFRTEHNSPIYLTYSDDDGATWSADITISADQNDYMQIEEYNSKIWMWSRYGTGNATKNLKMWYSDDNGATWNDAGIFVTLDANMRAYPSQSPKRNDTNWVYCAFNRRNDAVGGITFPETYFLKTQDGDTYYNVDGSWNKQVSVGGAITQAELNTNALIESVAETQDFNIWITTSIIGEDGNPYMITNKNGDTGLRFTYWNGSSWTQKDISGDYTHVAQQSPNGLYHVGGNTFYLWMIEKVSGYAQINKYKTIDAGTSWTFVQTETTNLTREHYLRAGISHNFQEEKAGTIYGMYQVTPNPIIVMQDDFTGTTIDTSKWTVTNPNSSSLLIEQNEDLRLKIVSNVGTIGAYVDYIESDYTITDGALQATIQENYTDNSPNGAFVFGLWIDSSNSAVILRYNTGNVFNMRLYITVGGVNQYDSGDTGVSLNNTVKITIDASNNIKYWYLSGVDTWTQLGTTQTYDIGTNKSVIITGGKVDGQDTNGDYISIDDVYLTNEDYDTSTPIPASANLFIKTQP